MCLTVCLTVLLRWSHWQMVTGTTRTPSFRKPPMEGRRLTKVVACEVRALPASHGCPLRPACCVWLWLGTG